MNETGEMEIEFSRDRNGGFEPQLVKKHRMKKKPVSGEPKGAHEQKKSKP